MVPMEKGTFENAATALFDSLPNDIKSCSDYYDFSNKSYYFLRSKVLRSFSILFNIGINVLEEFLTLYCFQLHVIFSLPRSES